MLADIHKYDVFALINVFDSAIYVVILIGVNIGSERAP
jgi:hypothetical protein